MLVAFAAILLFVVNLIADKYLRGDFTNISPDDDDDDYISDTESREVKNLIATSPFREYSEDEALKEIARIGFVSTFTKNASLHMYLEYKPHSKCLLGNFHSLKELDFKAQKCPVKIRFHIKLSSNTTFSQKTKWRPANSKLLALTFTLGPISNEEFSLCVLKARLYGISRGYISKPICFGECFVSLNKLESNVNKLFIKRLLPTGTEDHTTYVTSDSKVEKITKNAELASFTTESEEDISSE